MSICFESRVCWTLPSKWPINKPIEPIAQVSPSKLGQSTTTPILLAMTMKWEPQQQLGHKSDIKFPATTLGSSKIFNDSHFLRPTLVDRKTSNCYEHSNTHHLTWASWKKESESRSPWFFRRRTDNGPTVRPLCEDLTGRVWVYACVSKSLWAENPCLCESFFMPDLVLWPREPRAWLTDIEPNQNSELRARAHPFCLTQPFAKSASWRITNDNCTQVAPNLVSRSAVFPEIIISYFIAAMWHRQGSFS